MEITTLMVPLLIMVAGLLLLVGGGELLVGGAGRLARYWGMSPLLVGLTVVAFGTSLPELFISLVATWRGHPEIMLGNVIGSNIANIGLILGISVLVAPLALAFRVVAVELIILHLASAVLFGLAWLGFFPRPVGMIFVLGLVAYTVTAYHQAAKVKSGRGGPGKGGVSDQNGGQNAGQNAGPSSGEDTGRGWALLLVLVGLGALAGGSELFLRGAVEIARGLGISELVIGLTLAAVGTSLPELATCFSAIRQRQDAMLVGNIIGSNIFNLLMVMGVTGSLLPFSLPAVLLQRDLPVMLAFSLALLLAIVVRGRMGRLFGLLLLGGYAGYLYSLFG